MPLVTCPDCEKQISDAAPACIYCGRPFQRVGRAEPDLPTSPVHGRALLRCPQCGSDDVRRLSVVYASGLSSLESSSSLVGVGVGDGGEVGIAAGGASTSGIQQTALAKAAAPPIPHTVSWGAPGGVGCVVGMFVAALVGTAFNSGEPVLVIWIIVGVVVAKLAYDSNYKEAKKYNDAVYRPKKAIWDRSIMCMRCGTMAEEV